MLPWPVVVVVAAASVVAAEKREEGEGEGEGGREEQLGEFCDGESYDKVSKRRGHQLFPQVAGKQNMKAQPTRHRL